MSRRALVVLFALAVASVAATVSAQTPTATPQPDDFAYGIELGVDGSSALYRASLPLDVYRHTRRPDLGDLRVFNAADEAVPFSVRPPEQPNPDANAPAAPTIRLAHFPVYAESGAPLDNLSLRVTTSTSGAILSLDARPSAAGSTDAGRLGLISGTTVTMPRAGLKRAKIGSMGRSISPGSIP